MILLGVYQRRYLDRFSVASIALMCVSGVCALVVYGQTEYFPAAALGLTAILLIHWMVLHFPLHKDQSCRCVFHHETWVLVTAVAGLVSAFRV
jgi:4-hydroxybenzoate polyprenyltransferase